MSIARLLQIELSMSGPSEPWRTERSTQSAFSAARLSYIVTPPVVRVYCRMLRCSGTYQDGCT